MSRTRDVFLLLIVLSGDVFFCQSVSWTLPATRYTHAYLTTNGKIIVRSAHKENGDPGNRPDTLRCVDGSGTILWEKVLPEQLTVSALSPAPDGGFFVCGIYYGHFIYSGYSFSAGTYQNKMWIARCASDGSFIWVNDASSSHYFYPSDISCGDGRVAICGAASDSISFMDQSMVLPWQNQAFLATFSDDGRFDRLFYSQNTNTVVGSQTFRSFAYGFDCDFDGAGSVYLLMRTYGRTMVDSLRVGYWNEDNEYGPYTTALVKFDKDLHPIRSSILNSCVYYCPYFGDLEVSSRGDCYFTESFSNGQSGNDDVYSAIHKLNGDGSDGGQFNFPQSKSYFEDISLDVCGRLAFVGIERTPFNSNVAVTYTVFAGQLAPDLSLNWIYDKAVGSNNVSWSSMAVLKNGDLFTTGSFDDTLQLDSAPPLGADHGGGFYARLNGPSQFECTTVGIEVQGEKSSDVSLFPNPASGIVNANADGPINSITVYSVAGLKLLQTNQPWINTIGLSSGIYLVKVETAQGNKSLRLIVEK